jgi:hypothetical protein
VSVGTQNAGSLQSASAPALQTERWNLPLIFAAVAIVLAKLAQEYAIHRERWLDNITAVDAVESIWRFLVPF